MGSLEALAMWQSYFLMLAVHYVEPRLGRAVPLAEMRGIRQFLLPLQLGLKFYALTRHQSITLNLQLGVGSS